MLEIQKYGPEDIQFKELVKQVNEKEARNIRYGQNLVNHLKSKDNSKEAAGIITNLEKKLDSQSKKLIKNIKNKKIENLSEPNVIEDKKLDKEFLKIEQQITAEKDAGNNQRLQQQTEKKPTKYHIPQKVLNEAKTIGKKVCKEEKNISKSNIIRHSSSSNPNKSDEMGR